MYKFIFERKYSLDETFIFLCDLSVRRRISSYLES